MPMDPHPQHRAEPVPLPADAPPPQRVVRAEELLGDQHEVLIQHGSEYYRLRLTRNGRLLLTK